VIEKVNHDMTENKGKPASMIGLVVAGVEANVPTANEKVQLRINKVNTSVKIRR
jgi:hypothetical protein